MESARPSLASGLCYLVAWGPDCERVHDIFGDRPVPRTLFLELGAIPPTDESPPV